MTAFTIENDILKKYKGNDTTVIIPDGIEEIGEFAFSSCIRLESVVLPEGLKKISWGAFIRCTSIKKIEIPRSTEVIEKCAFEECINLAEVVIHNPEIYIQPDAFKKCTALCDENGFLIVGDKLIHYCGQNTEAAVPEGIVEIAEGAFHDERRHNEIGADPIGMRITKVTLPESVRKIGNSAFANCEKLEEMKLPEELESIGEMAFLGCGKLKEIPLPLSLSALPRGVFAHCSSLKKMEIHAGITEIGENAFLGCFGIEEYSVSEDNPAYTSLGGWLYSKDGKTLLSVACCFGISEVVIPEHVENIAPGAFCFCSYLKKVTLPKGIKRIGENAFSQTSGWGTGLVEIIAESGSSPEYIAPGALGLPGGTKPLFFPKLPVDYIDDKAIRNRLALAYCQYHDKYADEYAQGYKAYAIENLAELKRMADKQKLTDAQAFIDELMSTMPAAPLDYAKLKPVEKVEALERAVIRGDMAQVEEVIAGCKKKFEFTARALGIACRYRSLDMVKLLVENGASFYYDKKPSFKTRYAAAYVPKYSNNEYWAEYELMLVYNGLDPKIPTVNGSAYDVHFGGMPLVKGEVNAAEVRAEIAAFLAEKCEVNISRVLLYALMWGCREVAEALLAKGVKLENPELNVLDGSVKTTARSEMLATLPLLTEENCAYATQKYGELAAAAGRKFIIPQKSFEEENTVLLSAAVLAQVVKHADGKKLSKAKILDAVALKNDVPALGVLADAGWLDKKAQMDKLVQLMNEHNCVQASAWLMDYMNKTVDFAKEAAREEKKMMRELNAKPTSVTALKKLWAFEELEDGTLLIKDYKGNDAEIAVPDMIGEKKVSCIGERAFSPETFSKTVKNKDARARIESIVVPEGIVTIKDGAFYGCTALKEVQLPQSLLRLDGNVFNKCPQLEKVNLSRNVAVVGKAFSDSEKLRDEKGFIIFENRLFDYAGGDTCITVPDGIEEIMDFALAPVTKDSPIKETREICLPGSLKKIGRGAFSNLSNLEKIEVPEGVKEIGDSAFSGCGNLASVKLPATVKAYGKSLFNFCTGLQEIELPEGITSIGISMFEACHGLKKIVIPESVTKIDSNAFRYCKLETLFIPASVKTIEDGVFSNMPNLREIWLPASIKKLDRWFLGSGSGAGKCAHTVEGSKAAAICKLYSALDIRFDYPEKQD